MKNRLVCCVSALLCAASFADNIVTDSFIRDGVKPEDIETLTQNAKNGRTHLASTASGFFITRDGFCLTNYHVVEDASEVVVLHKDTAYRADVVAKSKKRDLALLKINLFPRAKNGMYAITERPTVPFLEFSDGVTLGQTVYAFGFPMTSVLGYDPKVTKGIVSCLTGYKGQSDNFQMDATISSGNSGGPVVDEYGNMVGVSVATAHGASLGANYAINIESVRKFIPNGIKYVRAASGRTLRTEKLTSKVFGALVFVLNYKEGACERVARTVTPESDVRARENETKVKKAILDARLCKLRKDWDGLRSITDWILETCGDVGDVREWNDLARDELGLHIVIIAEADGHDVRADVKPVCGFKDEFVECGKAAALFGGREKRGFSVEAKLEYEDEEWFWKGDLKCRYDWRGTKEVRVVLKRAGKK